jgi:hypothetical protein
MGNRLAEYAEKMVISKMDSGPTGEQSIIYTYSDKQKKRLMSRV